MWLKESNRPEHLFYGIISGLIGTIIFVIGLAIGMEFKDYQYGNKFDWLDLIATILGGAIGQFIQLLLLMMFML